MDLVSQYRLLPHYDFFCKRSLPLSISDTHYLHNVVGDTEIRKGDGMQLGQLTQYTSLSRETNTRSQPFDLDILSEAFQLRETTPVDLPSVSTFYSLNLRKGQSFCLALLISTLVTSHSLRRVLLQFLGNLKLGLKKRRKNIRSIRTKTNIKTTRSTSIGIKIEVKTRTRRRKRRELAFRILGMIIQEDIMRRFVKHYFMLSILSKQKLWNANSSASIARCLISHLPIISVYQPI